MKRTKLLLGLVVIFVSGIGVGIGGTGYYIRYKVETLIEGGPAVMHELIVKRIQDKFDLDKQQSAHVSVVISEAQKEFAELRMEQMPKIREVMLHAVEQMNMVLSAKQRKEFNTRVKTILKRLERKA